jgi:hypothetical protein
MKLPSLIISTFAVVCALVAIIIANNALIIRHWLVLVTFGKFSPIKTYGRSCESTPILDIKKSTRFTTHRHCFNATGDFFWHDAKHNETTMKAILLQAVADHCPILIHRPFKDHKCYERLRRFGKSNPNLLLRAKVNTDEFMDGGDVFPK